MKRDLAVLKLSLNLFLTETDCERWLLILELPCSNDRLDKLLLFEVEITLLELGCVGGIPDPSQDGLDQAQRVVRRLLCPASYEMLVFVVARASTREPREHLRR